jgi:hypothetical protein
MGFEFYAEHVLSSSPQFHSVLHEMRDENDQQMMVMHIDVHELPSAITFSAKALMRGSITGLGMSSTP